MLMNSIKHSLEIFEQLPKLEGKDIADAVIYALATPSHVQVKYIPFLYIIQIYQYIDSWLLSNTYFSWYSNRWTNWRWRHSWQDQVSSNTDIDEILKYIKKTLSLSRYPKLFIDMELIKIIVLAWFFYVLTLIAKIKISTFFSWLLINSVLLVLTYRTRVRKRSDVIVG